MKLQLALLGAAMAVGVSAQATLLVHEPFDGPVGVSLAGSGSGTGWGGNWTHQVSGNIKYAANMSFSSLATSGGSAMLEGPYSINADHAITRAVSFAGSVGDTVWTSFLWHSGYRNGNGDALTSGQFPWTIGGIEFGDTESGTRNFRVRPKAVLPASPYTTMQGDMRIGGGSSVMTGATVAADTIHARAVSTDTYANTAYLMLLKASGGGTTTQTLTQWALTEAHFATLVASGWDESILSDSANYFRMDSYTNSAAVAAEAIAGSGSFVRITYKQNGSTLVDELRVGTTLQSVTPVPEPAAMLVGALGLLGLGLRRRSADHG